jgi:hypothetical protein
MCFFESRKINTKYYHKPVKGVNPVWGVNPVEGVNGRLAGGGWRMREDLKGRGE